METVAAGAQKRPHLILGLIVFVGMLGYGIIIPITPSYAHSFGASDTTIGLLIGSYALMQFIFAPILGRLSDRYGRRPVLLVSLAGTIGSLLLFASATNLFWLFAGRMLDGLTGGNISIAQAYISDTTTEKNRARGMGILGAALGLGFIGGPALGGFLSRNNNYQLPIWVAAGVATLSFLLTLFLLPEPARHAERWRGSLIQGMTQSLRHPQVGRLLGITFLIALAFTAFETTFVLFVERRLGFGTDKAGYTLAYIGIVVAIVQGGLIRRWVQQYGESWLIWIGSVLLGIGLGLFAGVAHWWQLLLVGTLIALGEGMLTPSLSSLISRRVSPEERGQALGMYQSMGSLSRIIAPMIGTFLLDKVWDGLPYVIGALLVGCAAFVALPQARKERRVEVR